MAYQNRSLFLTNTTYPIWKFQVGLLHIYLRFPSEWQLYNLVTEPTRVRGFLHHLGKKRYSGGSHTHKKMLRFDSLNHFSSEPINHNSYMAQPNSKGMEKYISLVCLERGKLSKWEQQISSSQDIKIQSTHKYPPPFTSIICIFTTYVSFK